MSRPPFHPDVPVDRHGRVGPVAVVEKAICNAFANLDRDLAVERSSDRRPNRAAGPSVRDLSVIDDDLPLDDHIENPCGGDRSVLVG